EHVDHEPALERRELLHLPLQAALERARGREQPLDVVAGDVLDRDEVPSWRRGGRRPALPPSADLRPRAWPPRGGGRDGPVRPRRPPPRPPRLGPGAPPP